MRFDRSARTFRAYVLEHLLQACHGTINKAARVAQKNRRALFELIQKHEIDVEQYRNAAIGGQAQAD